MRAARRRRDDDATRRDDDATRRRGRGDGAGVCSPHAFTVAAGPQRWLHDAVLSESLQPPGQSPQVPSQSCHPCSPQVPLTVAAAPQPHRPHCSSSPDQKGWVRIEPLGDDEAQRRRCGDDEATTNTRRQRPRPNGATEMLPPKCRHRNHRNVATEPRRGGTRTHLIITIFAPFFAALVKELSALVFDNFSFKNSNCTIL